MKKRTGFISNSSSSSFIILKSHLSAEQIDKIKNHSSLGKELGIEYWDDAWSIHESDNEIVGTTWMDNYPMHHFLTKIGVNEDHVKWGHD